MVRKPILQLAGFLNLIVGFMAVFLVKRTSEQFHGTGFRFANLDHRIYFTGFFFFVFVFGLIYFYVARDTNRFSGIIALSSIGKFGVFEFATFLFLQDRVTPYGMTVSTLNDLVMSGIFLWIAFSDPGEATVSGPGDSPDGDVVGGSATGSNPLRDGRSTSSGT